VAKRARIDAKKATTTLKKQTKVAQKAEKAL